MVVWKVGKVLWGGGLPTYLLRYLGTQVVRSAFPLVLTMPI